MRLWHQHLQEILRDDVADHETKIVLEIVSDADRFHIDAGAVAQREVCVTVSARMDGEVHRPAEVASDCHFGELPRMFRLDALSGAEERPAAVRLCGEHVRHKRIDPCAILVGEYDADVGHRRHYVLSRAARDLPPSDGSAGDHHNWDLSQRIASPTIGSTAP